MPAFDSFDSQHLTSVEGYLKQIERAYSTAIGKLSQIASNIPVSQSPFSVVGSPLYQQQFKSIFTELADKIKVTVLKGINDQWLYGDQKALQTVTDKLKGKVSEQVIKMMHENKFGSTLNAYNAFISRTKNGLNLSERVWNFANQFKNDMELGMAIGIAHGTSASDLAIEMQKYLKEPDRLYRSVKNAAGELGLSIPASKYHPGQGIYRSSYKNALRMTRSEINMAYRRSENARYQSLPFVVGFRVNLSNAHPQFDICDELKGEYPKQFIFSGWHPQCLCHVTSILNTDEEFDKLEQAILNGDPLPTGSANEITAPPDGFMKWTNDNLQRSQTWKNQPYFIQDNFVGGTLDGGLKFIRPIEIDIPETELMKLLKYDIDYYKKKIASSDDPDVVKKYTDKIAAAEKQYEEFLQQEKFKLGYLDFKKSGKPYDYIMPNERFEDLHAKLMNDEISPYFHYGSKYSDFENGIANGDLILPSCLTKDEAYSIYLYTTDKYGIINDYFNKREYYRFSDGIEAWKEMLNHSLSKLVKNSPVQELELFRGTRLPVAEIKKLELLADWSNSSYFSTSLLENKAFKFCKESYETKKKVKFYIKSKQGCDISEFSDHKTEAEILFAHGKKWKVLSVEYFSIDDSYLVYLTDF